MDCSPPGTSVHGVLQARIPGWLPFPSSGSLPNPGIKPMSRVCCVGRWILYSCAWEAQQWAYLVPRSWILLPFVHKRSQGSLEKWLILGLGQEISQMSFQHLALPERNKQEQNTNGGVSECQSSQLERRPVAEWGLVEQQRAWAGLELWPEV